MPRNEQPPHRRGPEVHPELAFLRRLSHWLDAVIRLPGGFRIGLDGLIGLIPGVGDAAGAVIASYIIGQAARLGVPTSVLLRMIGNVLLEALIGVIPFLGDLFDFVWKANLRNVELLERHMGRASVGERGSRRLSYVLMAVVVLAVVAIIAVIYLFVLLIIRAIAAL